MPFVERDRPINGEIVALYARPQRETPKEFLPDDDPAVIAFNTPPPDPTNAERMDTKYANDKLFQATITQIALMRGMTADDVFAEMKTQVER